RKSLAGKFAGKGVDFDDICQQIDLKLIEGICDYDETLDSSAIRHITSKARNGIWNYYRKEMDYFNEDRKTISLDYGYSVELNGYSQKLEDVKLNYIETVYQSDKFDEDAIIDKIMLEQEINNLTDRQKDILLMYYMSDMTQQEIAGELDIHQTNVSRATKRGVR